MNILDSVILVLFIVGIMGGIKKGFIKGTVALIGTIIVFVLAFYLKNPIAKLFYTYLPFFDFGGKVVINILLYELLAFLIMTSLLGVILGILLKISGFIEKIFNITIVLGLLSKLAGAIVGLIESYILIFIMLIILNQPYLFSSTIQTSRVAKFILNNSLVLSNVASKTTDTVNSIYDLTQKYKDDNNTFNYEALDVIMKNKIITSDSVLKLKEKDKLNFNGIDNLINKYKED